MDHGTCPLPPCSVAAGRTLGRSHIPLTVCHAHPSIYLAGLPLRVCCSPPFPPSSVMSMPAEGMLTVENDRYGGVVIEIPETAIGRSVADFGAMLATQVQVRARRSGGKKHKQKQPNAWARSAATQQLAPVQSLAYRPPRCTPARVRERTWVH